MAPQRYGVALREQFGHEGYEALEAMMEDKQKDFLTVDRFERRMTEEGAARQKDVAALRQEMVERDAVVRQEIAGVRLEVAGVRLEVAGVRQDIGTMRFDLVKWMFVFWTGHTFVVAGLVIAMLSFLRP